MLIATLPTLVDRKTELLAEEIISHGLINAVRYNTGGASPYAPQKILETLKPIADLYGKILYVDLEGRQIRIARWTPFSRGVVTLNRDFAIELPGQIHFRRAGWFNIVNVLPEEGKIFFEPYGTRNEYYLGESQSVHVVAKKFEVNGYLNGTDFEYIKAAVELGISNFMLSFVESLGDISEFWGAYHAYGVGRDLPQPRLVLKIESRKGMQLIRSMSKKMLVDFQLMAARDDLFLGFVNARSKFLDALRFIVKRDPEAIVASKIMTGLQNHPNEITIGDMTDIVLMRRFGYKHFMWPDELADCFDLAMRSWREIALPLLGGRV